VTLPVRGAPASTVTGSGVGGSGSVATDRQQNPAESGRSLPSSRIDTITVRGPVDPETLDSAPIQRLRRELDVSTGEIRDRTTGAVVALDDITELHIDTRNPSGRPEVRLSFSVPGRLHGHNAVASPLEDAVAAVFDLFTRTAPALRWQCAPEDLRVTRIDVVRDFIKVPEPGRLLMALSAVRVPRVAPPWGYFGTEPMTVQTLYRESADRWLARTYCKGPQLRDRAMKSEEPAGSELLALAVTHQETLRYELEMKRKLLHEEGMSTVGDLRDDRLTEIAHRYFERSGLSAKVGGRVKINDALVLLAATGEYRHVRGVISTLWCDAYGFPAPYGDRAAGEHRKQARALGLTTADVVIPEGVPVRLDYYSGTAVQND
jgi:hypothetical protein